MKKRSKKPKMKRFIKISILWFVFFYLLFPAASFSSQQPPFSIDKAAQAIVKVRTTFPDGKDAHGTGFFVKNKEGKVFIVTDFHVGQKFLLGKTR